jgi:soluble lytic murein transglycosylase-like protein
MIKSGGGISSIEARVRQLENMIAAFNVQNTVEVPVINAGTVKQKPFMSVLEAEANKAHGLGQQNLAPVESHLRANPGLSSLSPGALQAAGEATGISSMGWNAGAIEAGKLESGGGGAAPPWRSVIQQLSQQYGVDPLLVESLVQQESGFNARAQSKVGAQGLMQLMPATAQALGVKNSLDPAQNLDGGIRYLKEQLERYKGNIPLALAAYNAGPGAVDKHGGQVPPYRETQDYVQRILKNYLKAKQLN